MTAKQLNLQNAVEHLNDEQCQLLLDIIYGNATRTTMQLLKAGGYNEEQIRKVDSAYPEPYANRIRDVLPTWNGSFHAYDYNRSNLGEMVNCAEKFVLKVNQIFR